MGTLFFIGVGVIVAVGVAAKIAVAQRRHQRNHRAQLEPELAAHGLTYISEKWPGRFQVGPFPKFEVVVGRPHSQVGRTRGEYEEYRVVTVEDGQGNVHKLWAMLEFELFRLRRVRWRATNAEAASPEFSGLLEK